MRTPPASELPPLKTALGQDELRRRTLKLSQRHRTVLLLVDGKRGRDEVLALAEKAGVVASFFDELVAMGLVEQPVPPHSERSVEADPVRAEQATPGPARAPAEPIADATGVAEDLAADPARVGAPVLVAQPAVPPAAERAPASASSEPVPAAEEVPLPPAVLHEAPLPPPAPVVGVKAPKSARPAPAARRPTRARASPPMQPPEPTQPMPASGLTPAAPPPRPEPAVAAPMPAPGAPDQTADADEAVLSEVRSLLISALLIDGPVSGSLTALRIGRARSRRELSNLAWEVERSLVRGRRPRSAHRSLEHARELLGLGNTLVHEDTQPGDPRG